MTTDPDSPENAALGRANEAYAGGLRLQEQHERQREWETIEAMGEHGGSFVKALAAAIALADFNNRARIIAAFPDYWQKYDAIAHPTDQEGPQQP